MDEVINVFLYTYDEDSDKSPYEDWERELPLSVQSVFWNRLARIRLGNFGDTKAIRGGGRALFELKIQLGPGYRIYFGREGKDVVILLCGGDKGSQKRDIAKASKYWKDYQASQRKKKKRG